MIKIKPLFGVVLSGIFLFCSLSMAADEGKIVKVVDVRGNKTVSSLTILAKVKTQIGQPVSSTGLNEDLKRLYGLGYFTDVKIEQEEAPGGVNVIFLVTEKPVLAEIKIEGNNKIGKDAIKKEMQSVTGDFVDQKRIRDDIDAIRKLYEKKGFSEAKVESSFDVKQDTNQATLRVMINEGLKLRIIEIRFSGNNSVKTGDILKAMKTKAKSWWGWFHSGYLKDEDVQEDLERIKALYDEAGFSDVDLATETQAIKDGDIILKVIVNEGKKYIIGNIEFKGNAIVKSDELLKTIKMTPAKPPMRDRVRASMMN